MTGWSSNVEPCPPEAREAALQVLYQQIPGSLRPRLIDEVLQEAASGKADLSGLWVAWDRTWNPRNARRRIIGTLLTQALAGRAAAIWAPEVLPTWKRDLIAASLVRSALTDLQSRGFRIVQAVLDESASHHGAMDLTRGGVPRVTELLYLERDTKSTLPELAGRTSRPWSGSATPDLVWRPFHEASDSEFRTLLQATYISSLDMPELEQVARSMISLKAIAPRAGSSLTAGDWDWYPECLIWPSSCCFQKSLSGTSGKWSTWG